MKKIKLLTKTFLALVLLCVGTTAWAGDYVLAVSTYDSSNSSEGHWACSNGFSLDCSGQKYSAGSGTTAGYMKMNRNKTWTVNIPTGYKATAVKIEGWSNKGTGSSTVSEINGDTGNSYTYPNTGSSQASNTYSFASPVTGSFTFKTGGDNQLALKITVTATSTPTLTGAWSNSSDTFYQGDAAPSVPAFTVGASDSSSPASSAYNVAYSLKAGSTDGIVTFDEADGISAISNSTVGTATNS